MARRSPLEWLGPARLISRLGYLVILLIATLIPFVTDTSGVSARIARAFHPDLGGGDVIDGARNIVLFAGWGAVWALTAVTDARRIVLQATVTGLLASSFVEFCQLFSGNRVASIIDVATNTGGALAGAIGLLVIAGLAQERRGARSFVGMPALFFGASYAIAVFLEMVIPLFRHDSLVASGGPLSRIRVVLESFTLASVTDIPWSDFLIFFPAGVFAVATLVEFGQAYPAAKRTVWVGGLVLSILAEVMHAPVGQPILLGWILWHTLAIATGAWACARWLPGLTVALRGAARPQALELSYMLVLAFWAWRPYLPEYQLGSILAKFQGDWYLPLAALGMSQDFFSVVDVCSPFFLYLPLGGLLAVWPWRRRGRLSGPLPGIWLSLALETSQILVAGRMMDITDFMVTGSGVLVGWAIFRRAGYQAYGETFPAASR